MGRLGDPASEPFGLQETESHGAVSKSARRRPLGLAKGFGGSPKTGALFVETDGPFVFGFRMSL